jgi:hypothetical protein
MIKYSHQAQHPDITHMNTQSKNAYEIRLEVLSIAHGDLMEIYHQKLHNAKIKMLDDGSGWTEEKIDDNIITDLLPTPADVIKRAKELYTFVEGV